MPYHKSAEKRVRQTEKRTAVNGARKSRVGTYVKKVETAIETGDKTAAQSAFQEAQPELHRAINQGRDASQHGRSQTVAIGGPNQRSLSLLYGVAMRSPQLAIASSSGKRITR